MSAGSRAGEARSATRALRVQAVFHLADEQKAQAVAARMIDSAHEIANLPECECDVDVSVELAQPDHDGGLASSGGAPPNGSAVKD